jgi:putative nucleotidyltransferase with HDIG domain
VVKGYAITVDQDRLEDLRVGVRQSLPEIEQIQDEELQLRVVDAQALALSYTEYNRIEEIPPEGIPGGPAQKKGTQADHYRGVALMALGLADGLEKIVGEIGFDRDILLAGGLCHDIGKAWEFSPRNRERWNSSRPRYGGPSMRHPVFGIHVAIAAGLPEEIAHIVGAHSYQREGAWVTASLENTIIQYADVAYWEILGAGGLMTEKK